MVARSARNLTRSARCINMACEARFKVPTDTLDVACAACGRIQPAGQAWYWLYSDAKPRRAAPGRVPA